MKNLSLFRINLIASCMLLILLLGIVTYTFFQNEKASISESKEETLKTVADFKINQISSWYIDEVHDIDIISRDESLLELIRKYMGTDSSDDKIYLLRFLNQLKTEHLYSDVLLLTPEGKILASTNLNGQAPEPLDLSLLQSVFKNNKGQNTDFYKSSFSNKIYFDFITTVRVQKNSKPIFLVCRKDPEELLHPLLKTMPGAEKTSETYLVKKSTEGLILKYNPNQDQKSRKKGWQTISKKDEISIKASSGFRGIFNGENENGKPVTAFVSPIPQTPWQIVVKTNRAEILKSLYRKTASIFLIALLLIVIFIIGALLLYKSRREKYLKSLLANEKELRQYQERFNMTMDILGEGVCFIRQEDQTIVLANPRMNEMFGYNEGELLGKNVTILLAPSQKTEAEIADEINLALDKENVVNTEWFNVRKDGTTFWTTAHTYFLAHDKFGPVWIGVLLDVTERKNYEDKLIRSEAAYKNLYENNPLPMWVYERETLRYLSVNNTAIEKYGYTIDEFLSMKINDIHPEDEQEKFNNYIRNLKDYQSTYVCKHRLKDGKIIYVEISSHKIEHYSKNARLVIANDITKTMEYEAQLIAAKEKAEESERLKTSFLANMSHEIRTPLNGILGFSQLLSEAVLDEKAVKLYSGYISEGGKRLLSLLTNILNFSKIESGTESLNLSYCNINDVLTGLFNQFTFMAREKGLEYKLILPENSSGIQLKTDVVKLNQILTNFLNNALKFTEKGSVLFGYESTDTQVTFFVKDTGIGIDPEKQAHIFERFYQVNSSLSSGFQGAGLGLSICKGFSELMKGEIRIDSILGKGSTFYFTLPLQITEA